MFGDEGQAVEYILKHCDSLQAKHKTAIFTERKAGRNSLTVKNTTVYFLNDDFRSAMFTVSTCLSSYPSATAATQFVHLITYFLDSLQVAEISAGPPLRVRIR